MTSNCCVVASRQAWSVLRRPFLAYAVTPMSSNGPSALWRHSGSVVRQLSGSTSRGSELGYNPSSKTLRNSWAATRTGSPEGVEAVDSREVTIMTGRKHLPGATDPGPTHDTGEFGGPARSETNHGGDSAMSAYFFIQRNTFLQKSVVLRSSAGVVRLVRPMGRCARFGTVAANTGRHPDGAGGEAVLSGQ